MIEKEWAGFIAGNFHNFRHEQGYHIWNGKTVQLMSKVISDRDGIIHRWQITMVSEGRETDRIETRREDIAKTSLRRLWWEFRYAFDAPE